MLNTKTVYAILGVIVLFIIGFFVSQSFQSEQLIDSDDIVACTMDAKICPDGTAVGRTGPNCEFEMCPNLDIIPGNNGSCFIGGCSSQVCSDQKDVMSTCEFREEYACYRTAKCERQTDGTCGWTDTPALRSCINNSKTFQ